ncbi:cell division protein FtsA [Candidatus Gracilibacteria bacterium]|nr:cell division protein FtsA [Candidatus Gracilibacteria bacterium]
MKPANIITTIDIGSSNIRTVIGYFDSEGSHSFHVLGIGSVASQAMRKGNILDMEEFKSNLDASLEEAEKMSGEQVNGAYISFNSSSLEVIRNQGVVAVSGGEITDEDIERSLDMVRNGVDMPNREILKVIPETFSVDLEDGVKNPLGMSGRKLEVVANIFSMNANLLGNIKKAVTDIGIQIYDVYPNLLTGAEAVLSKRQKELGTVCIDIGSSTTGVSVYEEGVLIFSSLIPIGGDSVTNDVALGLRTSTAVAEKLKCEYAELGLEKRENYTDTPIDLSTLDIGEESQLSPLYLSQIVTARYEEIFHFVRQELKKINRDGMLPEGAVCIGGGSKIKGFLDTAKESLRLPVFIGLPVSQDQIVDAAMSDPSYASVIGTMILADKYGSDKKMFSINVGGFVTSITNLFKKLLP